VKDKINTIALAICLALPLAAATELVGCAGNRYERSTGEYIDDKALSMRVRSALGDNPEYKFDDIQITSFRGTVQLSGFVNTAEQKSRAGDIAKKVEGVRNVENNVTVKERM